MEGYSLLIYMIILKLYRSSSYFGVIYASVLSYNLTHNAKSTRRITPVEVHKSSNMNTIITPYLERKIGLFLFLILFAFKNSFAVPQKFGMTVDYPTSVLVNETTTFLFSAGDDIEAIKVFVNGNSLGSVSIFKNRAEFVFIFKYGGLKKLSFTALNSKNEVVSELKGDLSVMTSGEAIKNTITLKTADAPAYLSNASAKASVPLTYSNYKFPPTPEEDPSAGRNSNAKKTAIGHPTPQESAQFIKEIQEDVVDIAKKNNLPASVIMGMAILESGYGYSRNAIMANNFFGLKWWRNSPKAIQMKGVSSVSNKAKVISGDEDRYIFDEVSRVDNWYRHFDSRKDCITFLVEEVLSHKSGLWQKDYSGVGKAYQKRIASGTSKKVAATTYIFELAKAGFTEQDAKMYQTRVLAVIERHNLFKLD